MLGLKVTKGELEHIMNNFNDGLTSRLDRQTLRLEIGTADRRDLALAGGNPCPYGAFKSSRRVHIEDKKNFISDEPWSRIHS